MRAARARLPAAAHAGAVEAALAAHRVLVVSGATGCGKSTQARPRTLRARAMQFVGGPGAGLEQKYGCDRVVWNFPPAKRLHVLL